MPIRRQRSYTPPIGTSRPVENFTDFSNMLNTRENDFAIGEKYLSKADNVRGTDTGGLQKRKGSLKLGQTISTATKVLGLHSYVDNDRSVQQLIAGAGTVLYKYDPAATGVTVATTTSAQGVGYSKDRSVFVTTNTDANGLPYVVVLYQNGSGIKLEWEDSPYNSWGNSVISIDNSTQIGFSGFMDNSDNIHLAYMSDGNTVKYVKLTYGAGPTWTVGTPVTVLGSGASDSAVNPSIAIDKNNVIIIAFRYYDGEDYSIRTIASLDSGATWDTANGQILNPTSNARHFAALGVGNRKLSQTNWYVKLYYQISNGTTTSYYERTWSDSTRTFGSQSNATDFITGLSSQADANATDNVFTVTSDASSLLFQFPTSGSASGISATGTGLDDGTGSDLRTFTVVNDGSNDNDIQYKNTVDGTTDVTATRVTNDSSNNLYPKSPVTVSPSQAFIPVVYLEGTGSPYNIKINAANTWTSIISGLTSGLDTVSTYFPSTNKIYFTNGTDAVRSWDGASAASASATGYPTPTWIIHFENRLWMGGDNNTVYYTNSGADNFASPGTFPSGNNITFPNQTVWGHRISERVLLVFDRYQVYRIENFDYTGATVGPEKIRSIPNSYGTLAGRTVVQVGYWVYYQRPDGHVMRTNGQYAELVSDVISQTVESMSKSLLSQSNAGTYGTYYYLAIAGNSSGQTNEWWVLDTQKAPNAGWSVDTGKKTSCFVQHPDANGVPQLYWGDSTTTTAIVYQGEIGGNDNGAAIEMDVRTGLVFYGDLYRRKLVRKAVIMAEADGDWDLTFGYALGVAANSFYTKPINLNPDNSTWGTGTWGTGTWGGVSYIEKPVNIYRRDRMFRYQFYQNGADQDVTILGFSTTQNNIEDVL